MTIMIDIKLMTPAEVAAELGQRLRRQRLALRLTQAEVAQRAGLNVGSVKNLESRTRTSSLETAIRVVLVLGMIDQFETLFAVKPLSIAQMQMASEAPRARARSRKRS
jgi:transcriptional regulator with XRE-family HTH domain